MVFIKVKGNSLQKTMYMKAFLRKEKNMVMEKNHIQRLELNLQGNFEMEFFKGKKYQNQNLNFLTIRKK